jgi:hypothetical protein
MEVALFVQLNTVPGTIPEKLIAAVEPLLHIPWLATAIYSGVGLTVIVNGTGVP